MGARVIAAASSEEKLDLCRERGADETINYATENLKDRAKELTGGQGCDVIYDCVGGAYAEAALRATAWEGRFLVIGFTAGIPSVPLNLTLLKSCQIVGAFYGAMAARDPGQARRHRRRAHRAGRGRDGSAPTSPPATRSTTPARRCVASSTARSSARSSSSRERAVAGLTGS